MNMKKIIWKIAVLIGVVTLLSVSVASCNQKDPIPGDSDDNEQTGGDKPGENPGDEEYGKLTGDEKVKAFFVNQIADGDWSYSDDRTVKRESVEEVRDAVWKLWKNANLTYQDEDKLPSLPVLGSSKDVFSWGIPKALEGEYVNGSFTGNDSKMTFHWGKSGDKPEGGYPVFIYLHGSGGPSSEWNTGYSLCQKWGGMVSGIYFDPLIPNGVTESSGFSLYRWWQKGKQYIWNRLIRQLFISTYANPDRLFFIGISEGAYGSARLSTFYADYLAGIGPIAGGEPLNTAPVENSANIAYFLRTGSEDYGYGRSTITKYTGEALDALSAAHPGYYDHWVYVEPGASHTSVDYDQAVPWLKDKVRKPYPKYVNWERLDQDGIYREGFYNLFIPDGGKPSDRRQYEMTISGNVVDIKVGTVRLEGCEWDERYGNCVKYNRYWQQTSGGKIRIYLCDELVDLDQAVVVKVNGKEVFNGKLERKYETVVNSCAIYFDPSRLYTSSVEVEY